MHGMLDKGAAQKLQAVIDELQEFVAGQELEDLEGVDDEPEPTEAMPPMEAAPEDEEDGGGEAGKLLMLKAKLKR